MALTMGRKIVSGTSKQVRKGAVAKSDLKNWEEVLQYHNGRLKIIRKEFGKIFELEFVQAKGRAEDKELKTFAKHSDIKKPARDAIKIFSGGVRAGTGKNFYGAVPEAGDGHTGAGEFEQTVDGSNVIPK